MNHHKPEWAEQLDHEQLKAWMEDHGWSLTQYANPLDVLEIVEELDDDSDSDDYSHITINL
jgi:hypothetical protein